MATLSLSYFDLSSFSRSENRRRQLHRFWGQQKSEPSWALRRRNVVGVKSFRAFYGGASGLNVNKEKGLICTADELHYVSVPNSDWKLALWRYLPSLRVHSHSDPTNSFGFCFFRNRNLFNLWPIAYVFLVWIVNVHDSGRIIDRFLI